MDKRAGVSAPIVDRPVDTRPLTWLHWRILGLCGAGWMFDAMDVTLLSMALPMLSAAWGLSPSQAGLIGSIDRLGALVGAVLAGVLADRLGRRTMFQLTLLVYSLGTGLLALAGSLPVFGAIRFLVGLGLGGELPVVATFASEMLPPRHRGLLMGFFNSFFNYGFILAAIVGIAVAAPLGWRPAFLVGALPCLLVALLRRYLPESPGYLLARGRGAEARKALASAGLDLEGPPAADAGRARAGQAGNRGLAALASPPYLRATALMGVVWFSLYSTAYATYVWLPSLLLGRGLSYVGSLRYTLLAGVAQVMGCLVGGYFADRSGRCWTLAMLLVLAAASAWLFGIQQGPAESLVLVMALGFFAAGAFAVATGYTPELFGTSVRGSGVGLATGLGRIGGTIAPFAVGLVLQSHPGPLGQVFVFLAITGFFLAAAVAVVALGRETRGRILEERYEPALGA